MSSIRGQVLLLHIAACACMQALYTGYGYVHKQNWYIGMYTI